MRMSVLLAQESEELGNSKVKSAVTSAVPSAKKKASRKQSREKQQYGSKDSVKVVNELSGPRSIEVRISLF